MNELYIFAGSVIVGGIVFMLFTIWAFKIQLAKAKIELKTANVNKETEKIKAKMSGYNV